MTVSPLLAGLLATLSRRRRAARRSRCCSTAGRSSASRGRAADGGAGARSCVRLVEWLTARLGPADRAHDARLAARGDRPPAGPRRAARAALTVQRYVGLKSSLLLLGFLRLGCSLILPAARR